ncbi:hypothetical protein ACJ41O_008456 [Fusarium nematophilum]
MFIMYLLCASFVVIALISTLVAGIGRRDGRSARETGLATIEDEAQIDVPAATAAPDKARRPWKAWLEAEMAAPSDPSRPWLGWKPDMDDPSDKPWLHWSKRKIEQGGSGACEGDNGGPTTEMMGTYPVINLARV